MSCHCSPTISDHRNPRHSPTVAVDGGLTASSASRYGFAAAHALAFEEKWPSDLHLRLPFSHQKKFHVPLRLSGATLPILILLLILDPPKSGSRRRIEHSIQL